MYWLRAEITIVFHRIRENIHSRKCPKSRTCRGNSLRTRAENRRRNSTDNRWCPCSDRPNRRTAISTWSIERRTKARRWYSRSDPVENYFSTSRRACPNWEIVEWTSQSDEWRSTGRGTRVLPLEKRCYKTRHWNKNYYAYEKMRRVKWVHEEWKLHLDYRRTIASSRAARLFLGRRIDVRSSQQVRSTATREIKGKDKRRRKRERKITTQSNENELVWRQAFCSTRIRSIKTEETNKKEEEEKGNDDTVLDSTGIGWGRERGNRKDGWCQRQRRSSNEVFSFPSVYPFFSLLRRLAIHLHRLRSFLLLLFVFHFLLVHHSNRSTSSNPTDTDDGTATGREEKKRTQLDRCRLGFSTWTWGEEKRRMNWSYVTLVTTDTDQMRKKKIKVQLRFYWSM